MSEPDEVERVGQVYAGYRADARLARAWSAENPGNRLIRDELVHAVFARARDALEHARGILDIGCGTGWWLERLDGEPSVGAGLYGVDVLDERVRAAQARVPRAQLAVADARALPHRDGTFDVITQFTVLSSLADARAAAQALAEARRVLRPGGLLLVWEPRLPNPRNRATFVVSPALVREVFAPGRVETTSITLVPPLARHLGRWTEAAYPQLVKLSALRSHRLVIARRDG